MTSMQRFTNSILRVTTRSEERAVVLVRPEDR
jgi:hypothetical protein